MSQVTSKTLAVKLDLLDYTKSTCWFTENQVKDRHEAIGLNSVEFTEF